MFNPQRLQNRKSVSPSIDDKDAIYKPIKTKKYKKFSAPLKVHWLWIFIWSLLWFVMIHRHERIIPQQQIRKCLWNNWEKWHSNGEVNPHRVALLADPQLVDDHTYPSRPRIINYFTKLISDNYLRRNNRFVEEILDPDTSIFLGDLFDGGREWKEDEWISEYKRFMSIYPSKINKRTIYSLPGNHDIGFGETIIYDAWERFQLWFGQSNQILDIGNHSIILLDTISLSHINNFTINHDSNYLLERLNSNDELSLNGFKKPRILLTHVPLYRDNQRQDCGPLRESKNKFPIQAGDQYQTVISHQLTQSILSKVKPVAIFSGDDHDYCHVTHEYSPYNYGSNILNYDDKRISNEFTIKSLSMTNGIKKPAIQLLSLFNDESNININENLNTWQTEICFMPNELKTIKSYLYFLIFELILLIIWIFSTKFSNLFKRNLKSLIHKQKLSNDNININININDYENDILPISNTKGNLGRLITYKSLKIKFQELFINCLISVICILMIFRHFYKTV